MELIRHKTKKPNRITTKGMESRIFSVAGPDKLELLAVAAYLDANGFRKNRINGIPVHIELQVKAENLTPVWAIHYKFLPSIPAHVAETRLENTISDYRRETGTATARNLPGFAKSKAQQSPTGAETC